MFHPTGEWKEQRPPLVFGKRIHFISTLSSFPSRLTASVGDFLPRPQLCPQDVDQTTFTWNQQLESVHNSQTARWKDSEPMRSFARIVQLQCIPSRAEITPFSLHQYELFSEAQCTSDDFLRNASHSMRLSHNFRPRLVPHPCRFWSTRSPRSSSSGAPSVQGNDPPTELCCGQQLS